jgi:peptide-methionine (S)-S-oxide reductase
MKIARLTTRRIAIVLLTVGIMAPPPVRAGAGPPAGTPAPAPSTGAARTPISLQHAVFAGGCFWCVEAAFEGIPGVRSVVSGYSGGPEQSPTYHEVSYGRTGHAESVDITFDPATTPYEKLLDIFWHNIDPTQRDGQFCDHGKQYRTVIFTADAAQERAALASKRRIEDAKRLRAPIVTEIVPLTRFWPAEEYHQDYYKKNPIPYQAYRLGCGRDARLKAIWGKDAGGH